MPGMIQPDRSVVWNADNTEANVTVTSMFSRKQHTMRLAITPRQWDAWQSGQYIQNAMPHRSPDEREFLLTGATQEEWDAEFGDDDEWDD